MFTFENDHIDLILHVLHSQELYLHKVEFLTDPCLA